MEVGRLGVHGTLAVNSVEPENKDEHEAVQNRHLATVVELALEHLDRIERATRKTAQVKSSVKSLLESITFLSLERHHSIFFLLPLTDLEYFSVCRYIIYLSRRFMFHSLP